MTRMCLLHRRRKGLEYWGGGLSLENSGGGKGGQISSRHMKS